MIGRLRLRTELDVAVEAELCRVRDDAAVGEISGRCRTGDVSAALPYPIDQGRHVAARGRVCLIGLQHAAGRDLAAPAQCLEHVARLAACETLE